MYIPKLESFLNGDILLTRSQEDISKLGSKQSQIIQIATRGSFSHAILCVTPPLLIEALGHGVSTLSLMTIFVHDLKNVRVLRYPNLEIAYKAANLAMLEVGRNYSIKKAIASLMPTPTSTNLNDSGTFCSALIAHLYSNAGSPEFKTQPIDKTTPATIEKMSGLLDVTSTVFEKSAKPANPDFSALDGIRKQKTITEVQRMISNECSVIFGQRIQKIFEEFKFLPFTFSTTLQGSIQFVLDGKRILKIFPSYKNTQLPNLISNLDFDLAQFIDESGLVDIHLNYWSANHLWLLECVENEATNKLSLKEWKTQLSLSQSQLSARRDVVNIWENRMGDIDEYGIADSLSLRKQLEIDKIAIRSIEKQIKLLLEITTF